MIDRILSHPVEVWILIGITLGLFGYVRHNTLIKFLAINCLTIAFISHFFDTQFYFNIIVFLLISVLDIAICFKKISLFPGKNNNNVPRDYAIADSEIAKYKPGKIRYIDSVFPAITHDDKAIKKGDLVYIEDLIDSVYIVSLNR